MPIFFQLQVNEHTRLGIWKIEETEAFFKGNVSVHRDVTHPHKRLQHLAGRFLLQYLYPDFPYELIQIADTRKPFLSDEQYHFSISHCGDYAAAIVSKKDRVGIDIEIPVEKITKIMHKFLTAKEHANFNLIAGAEMSDNKNNYDITTILWSAKEAIFKWYSLGNVDFRKDIQLETLNTNENSINAFFASNKTNLTVQYKQFDGLVLAWVFN